MSSMEDIEEIRINNQYLINQTELAAIKAQEDTDAKSLEQKKAILELLINRGDPETEIRPLQWEIGILSGDNQGQLSDLNHLIIEKQVPVYEKGKELVNPLKTDPKPKRGHEGCEAWRFSISELNKCHDDQDMENRKGKGGQNKPPYMNSNAVKLTEVINTHSKTFLLCARHQKVLGLQKK